MNGPIWKLQLFTKTVPRIRFITMNDMNEVRYNKAYVYKKYEIHLIR